MQVFLLAAGKGTRLKPLTKQIPKCLVKIKGTPLLEIWIKKFSKININSIIINTHYLSYKVNKFIKKLRLDKKIFILNEVKLLGTAGALKKNIKLIHDDDFFLIHADNYCEADLKKFITSHKNRPTNCVMTMMIFETKFPEKCGIVEIDSQGIVQKFYEKKKDTKSNLANAAIYLLSRKFFKNFINDHQNLTDFSNDIIPKLVGKIYTHKISDVLIDIGSIENYKLANKIARF